MELEAITTETQLCAVFMLEFNSLPGWTCHPEAAGFDVLVVHEDGRQIGVEAKLALNAKVADQILPSLGDEFYGRPGPDHRLVIVSKISDASEGIRKMLDHLGVRVLVASKYSRVKGCSHGFSIESELFWPEKTIPRWGYANRMFDWWPTERCRVPSVVTNLPAGVPSPTRLTPWKESALRVIAQMRQQGFITAKQIASYGIGVTAWTQAPGSNPGWLARGTARGQWIETEHMPAFDKQHPDVYALAVAEVAAKALEPLELTP
ncbi:hypothetical protein [Pseudomonas sp. LP_7_YM]|uniref:hypothetical protein n=1 Tax=Pseudomonas sp. LP_7_YM TaxID=2485137 RepID=UPI00105F0019|nr:hypothetical protein [Pseudomonas sp. LP_7_YM]TDV62650.1 hypothetical protein EC915_107237 [Pseudomonas sp. LP_7_YM]